jgi:hypothetical protein
MIVRIVKSKMNELTQNKLSVEVCCDQYCALAENITAYYSLFSIKFTVIVELHCGSTWV